VRDRRAYTQSNVSYQSPGDPPIKRILELHTNSSRHWVGDGFPVRSLFSYDDMSSQMSPFLLLDYAGPFLFEPTTKRRGVPSRL